MRRRAIIELIVAAAVVGLMLQTAGCYSRRSHAADASRREKQRGSGDLPERDEVHQTYQLKNGARVMVTGINGPVEIATGETDTAEVHIVRSAYNRDDLEQRKITVENTPTSLLVKGEDGTHNFSLLSLFTHRGEVRQRVTLKLPRQVEFATTGINGPVTIGEVDGAVRVSGINGSVKLAQAAGSAEISGINGSIQATIKGLGERGIRAGGINGSLELRFAEDLNANLTVSGLNGRLQTDFPNVVMGEKENRSHFSARIGEGGAPITISGLNGRLRLARAESANGSSAAETQ